MPRSSSRLDDLDGEAAPRPRAEGADDAGGLARGSRREVPVRPRKIRVTAAFDEEVVKWFRAMGHNYQARMNAVLQRLHAGDEVAGDRQPEGPRLEGGRRSASSREA